MVCYMVMHLGGVWDIFILRSSVPKPKKWGHGRSLAAQNTVIPAWPALGLSTGRHLSMWAMFGWQAPHPRGLPDRVELLMVLAGVVTSGSSWAHSAGGRAGFSGSSWRSPEQGAASPCSTSAEIASLGSRPELSLCLLLSVSEELDVDNCCLN